MKTLLKTNPSKGRKQLSELAEETGIKEDCYRQFHCFMMEMKMLELRMNSLFTSPLLNHKIKQRFRVMHNYVRSIEKDVVGAGLSSEKLMDNYNDVATALIGVNDQIAVWNINEIESLTAIAELIDTEGIEIEQQ